MSDSLVFELAERLGDLLQKQDLFLVTAESCTGGGVAEMVTRIPGSSKWFERGFVTYSNQSKVELLGVNPDVLEQYGAVSEESAVAMVKGALENSHARVGVAITGIAGPEGGSGEKPVGTVCIAWLRNERDLKSARIIFQGDRQQIRMQACLMALQGLIDILEM